MLCLNCSTPVPDDSKFCLSCGADLSDPAAEHTTSLTDDGVSNMERKLRGDTEGEFEIEGELGRGGMAVVYLATDVHLRRKVAIKVLPPDLTFGKGTIERFRREAQTAAQLDHPNIIPVYRISTGGDLFWYAMKYIEGRSLDEILKEGLRFDLGGCIEILDQVAAALDWAHRRQVVHRDVKPANIMIDPTGRVTMADFGIAKALSKTSLTASGSAIGTPNYMSPEQCMGGEITGAVDQYALGVVTYQMLSGKLPFEADSAVELIQKHCFVPPPSLEEARPGLPARVYAAVERALAKKSGERFASVTDFVGAMKDPARATAAGLISTPSATPIPTAMPSATPIPVDEQSTTPMPAATPVPVDEASTTPIPTATPSATPVTPPPTQPPGWDGAPTEVIGRVGKRRGVGVAALAIAALVVVAGGIGWLVIGRGADEPPPPAIASEDSSSVGLTAQSEPLSMGAAAGEGSEPMSAPGVGEVLESAQAEVRPPANDPPAAEVRTEETAQLRAAADEPTAARRDTSPAGLPVVQERRTDLPAAAAAVVVDSVEEPPTVREPPTGPGTEAWNVAVGYRGYGSPAIAADGTVYVGSSNRLVALNPDGSIRWSASTPGAIWSAPAVAVDGTVYVGAGNTLQSVSSTGSVGWAFDIGIRGTAQPAIGADRTVYIAAGMSLFAVRNNGSSTRWTAISGSPFVTAPAVGADGTVYVGAQDGLHAIDPEGRGRWVFPVGSRLISSPALTIDGAIYVVSGTGTLYALDRNGTPRWFRELPGFSGSFAVPSPIVGRDGTIFVGSPGGALHAIDRRGNPTWTYQVNGPVIGSPAIGTDGTIYVCSARGQLHAVNPDGSPQWRAPVGCDRGSLTLGSGGTVYVVSDQGVLHALRSESRGLANAPWPKAGHDNANSGFVGRD